MLLEKGSLNKIESVELVFKCNARWNQCWSKARSNWLKIGWMKRRSSVPKNWEIWSSKVTSIWQSKSTRTARLKINWCNVWWKLDKLKRPCNTPLKWVSNQTIFRWSDPWPPLTPKAPWTWPLKPVHLINRSMCSLLLKSSYRITDWPNWPNSYWNAWKEINKKMPHGNLYIT